MYSQYYCILIVCHTHFEYVSPIDYRKYSSVPHMGYLAHWRKKNDDDVSPALLLKLKNTPVEFIYDGMYVSSV